MKINPSTTSLSSSNRLAPKVDASRLRSRVENHIAIPHKLDPEKEYPKSGQKDHGQRCDQTGTKLDSNSGGGHKEAEEDKHIPIYNGSSLSSGLDPSL
ncbi:Hypothetical predicted protein [Olea europaea subsp. europaea]|uniref:Uncharacterized protein n=1 Tax=Olea europaea subsp. europaea TaxID=158383 RepID=A0A8S0VKL9_OLEEU|nr:Hypothetical predicted protein [Olea europaea subsp. europaea]